MFTPTRAPSTTVSTACLQKNSVFPYRRKLAVPQIIVYLVKFIVYQAVSKHPAAAWHPDHATTWNLQTNPEYIVCCGQGHPTLPTSLVITSSYLLSIIDLLWNQAGPSGG